VTFRTPDKEGMDSRDRITIRTAEWMVLNPLAPVGDVRAAPEGDCESDEKPPLGGPGDARKDR